MRRATAGAFACLMGAIFGGATAPVAAQAPVTLRWLDGANCVRIGSMLIALSLLAVLLGMERLERWTLNERDDA